MSSDRRFSPAIRQHKYAESAIRSFLESLQDSARDALHQLVDEKGDITHVEATALFKEEIGKRHQEWKALEFPEGVDEKFVAGLKAAYKSIIVRNKKELFPRHLTSVRS